MTKYFLDGDKLIVVDSDNTFRVLKEMGGPDAPFEDVERARDEAQEEVVDEAPQRSGRSGPRKCKNCGKLGHSRKTCQVPLKKEEDDEQKQDAPDIDPADEDLVWNIRSKFVVQKMSPPDVCHELEIDMRTFMDICKRYDIHR